MGLLNRMRRKPTMVPPEHLQTYIGGAYFVEIGDSFLTLFRDLGGLTPDDDVLDVGSGSGRMARPLVSFLSSTARYEGFDLSAEAVEWCRENISSAHPNFRFRHADIANTHYNPGGALVAEGFTFPYADASFDFVFATSVFTHMLPAGLDRYTAEIARVLRPGGRFFVTAYVWNADTAERSGRGQLQVPFPLDFDSYRTASDVLEAVVAYDEDYLIGHLTGSGLRQVGSIHTGSWTGRPEAACATFQDVVVLERRAGA